MTKHTPGQCCSSELSDNEKRAKARLNAAAPELLEACKEALEWLESMDPEQQKENDGLSKLRQAISKAEASRG